MTPEELELERILKFRTWLSYASTRYEVGAAAIVKDSSKKNSYPTFVITEKIGRRTVGLFGSVEDALDALADPELTQKWNVESKGLR